MTPLVSVITILLSLLTIGAQIGIVAIILLLFFSRHKLWTVAFIREHALALALFVVIFSIMASLFYSEFVGFLPCALCWYQRAFLFPQLLILAFALWKHDSRVIDYILGLSLIGAAIAAYHYYGQMFNLSILPCVTGTTGVSCSERYFVEFGYITIPMMSFTTFAMLLTIFGIKRFSSPSSR